MQHFVALKTHHPFPNPPPFSCQVRAGDPLGSPQFARNGGGRGEGVPRELATRSDLVKKLLA